MNFSNGAALLWLLPLVPIIIFFYLLKLRRQEMVVSSVLLWTRLVQDVQANAPFQRLKRNLLLFLQLLTVLFLVFCLARPFAVVSALGGATTVLVLDVSASMQSTDAGRSRFEEARGAGYRLIESMGRGDVMMILLAGTRTRVLTPFTSVKSELRRALREARVEDGTSDLRRRRRWRAV